MSSNVWRQSHGGRHEAYISAEQPSPLAQARVSPSDEHTSWSCDSQVAAGQGSSSPLGVTERLRSRSEFARLRTQGRRWRSGWLWCSVMRDHDVDGTRVGYVIGRQCGSAVCRNRTRRRLRHLVRDAHGRLGPGSIVFGVNSPGCDAPFAELRQHFDRLLERVEAS